MRGLPASTAALARIIGGVLVHRDCTGRFGFTLPQQRRDEANTRYVEVMLAYLGSLDQRRPEDRFAGTCRDFTVLLCAMLREAGIPAGARAGFAGYFADGFFDDHWVVEVWNDDRGWHLVDAQVASAPAGTYTDAEIDPLNVPRDTFLVAGQAWQQCRTGGRDPDRIGTSAAGLTGMWEVQGNVIRDLACHGRTTMPATASSKHEQPMRRPKPTPRHNCSGCRHRPVHLHTPQGGGRYRSGEGRSSGGASSGRHR